MGYILVVFWLVVFWLCFAGLYFDCDFMGCILVEFCQVVFCLCFDGLYFLLVLWRRRRKMFIRQITPRSDVLYNVIFTYCHAIFFLRFGPGTVFIRQILTYKVGSRAGGVDFKMYLDYPLWSLCYMRHGKLRVYKNRMCELGSIISTRSLTPDGSGSIQMARE